MLLVQALAKLLPRQQCAFLSRGTRRLTASLSVRFAATSSPRRDPFMCLLKPLHEAVSGDQARPVCSLWPSWLLSPHLACGHHPVLTALTVPPPVCRPLVCRPLVSAASRDWLIRSHFSSESALIPWGTQLGTSVPCTQSK